MPDKRTANRHTSDHYQMIVTSSALDSLCESLSDQPYVIIDTEFMRERTYRPNLCLVQIKAGDTLALVDTPAIDDLSALKTLLDNPAVTKVLHAAGQDLETFYWLFGTVPAPVFDTQLAAPLLGYDEQIGYGNLVKAALQVTLPKSHTRTDWARRPLSKDQIHYALDDVIYLETLYLQLREQLAAKERLGWLKPEFDALTRVEQYDKPANLAWLKVRAVQHLGGSALACVQALAEWREVNARLENRPRNWLIKDEVLVNLARQQPASVNQLKDVRDLSRRLISERGTELLELIEQARTTTPQPIPPYRRKQRLSPEQRVTLDLLKALVSLRAAELDINADLLAPTKLLEGCILTADSSSLSGWRKTLLQTDLDELLQGGMALGLTKGQVVRVTTR